MTDPTPAPYTLTRAERETHITRASDQDVWRIFSEDPVVVRKLTRLFGIPRSTTPFGGGTWDVPLRSVSFRKGEKPRKTPEQMEAARAAMAKIRKANP